MFLRNNSSVIVKINFTALHCQHRYSFTSRSAHWFDRPTKMPNTKGKKKSKSDLQLPKYPINCLRLHYNGNFKLADVESAVQNINKTAVIKTEEKYCKVIMNSSENYIQFLQFLNTNRRSVGIQNIVFVKAQTQQSTTGFSRPGVKPGVKYFETYKTNVIDDIRNGNLIEGSIRIPPKSPHLAFICYPGNTDILIQSYKHRNRALHGDVVAVELLPKDNWIVEDIENLATKLNGLNLTLEKSKKPVCLSDIPKDIKIPDKNLRKTGKVVSILKEIRNRTTVGFLELEKDAKSTNKVKFVPCDNSFPKMRISPENCPSGFLTRPEDFKNKMFMCKLLRWNEFSVMAQGELLEGIGNTGELEPETRRILTEFDVDEAEFPEHVLNTLPRGGNFKIPEEEISKRRDFRKNCVFTIDPSTARDLDDALHCEKIGDDLYEIGVHIADVSYFVKPQSPVDKIAARRCTSVYLVQRVVPMLPRVLCDDLCSLHPGVDRLAFSVVWKMTSKGEIRDEWFGRSIIQSCVKMSYDHAQSFITADENKIEASVEGFPEISGNWTTENLNEKVIVLNKIGQNLRKRRKDNGALRLDQIKLSYLLNEKTGLPDACFKYEYKKSNELIEEFMLLANIAVAHKLNRSVPKRAFLRCHPEPKDEMLVSLMEKCLSIGLDIDTSSSAAFSDSLQKAAGNDELAKYRLLALQLLAIKPQQLAQYFCAGCIKDEDDYRHYALNVPLYTHFTSPIRRYADLIVHRQLAKVLAESDEDFLKAESLQTQADLCNQRKTNSKMAQDASIQLYFDAMVKTMGSIQGTGVVVQLLDRAFDVLCIEYGFIKRVYCDELALERYDSVQSKIYPKNQALTLFWNGAEDEYKKPEESSESTPKPSNGSQTIDMFSMLDIVLEYSEKTSKIKTYIRRTGDDEQKLLGNVPNKIQE